MSNEPVASHEQASEAPAQEPTPYPVIETAPETIVEVLPFESPPQPTPEPQVETPTSLPPETPASEANAPAPPTSEIPQQTPSTETNASSVSEPLQSVQTPAPPSQPETSASSASFVLTLLAKARAAIQIKKRKKLDRIMEEVAKEGSITNDQVEKLLHVGDTTATRYLTALVKEGKLRRIGTTGKHVRYEKAH